MARKLGETFLEEIISDLKETGFQFFLDSLDIRFAGLGEEAILTGAARYYIDTHYNFRGSDRQTVFRVEGGEDMERVIAVNSNCYHGYGIFECLEGIHKAGFHYVELTATKGWTEHVFPDQSFEFLTSVKDRMEQLFLTPVALSGHCNLMDRERLQDFIMNIRLAGFFGCQYIVSSVGEAHLADRTKTGAQEAAENIRELLPWLEQYDLMLVLETHGEHGTGKAVKEIADLVGSERVRVAYDTANVIFYGGVNPAEEIEDCMDAVSYIHLKDKDGEDKEWNFPAPGKGKVDFPRLFQTLEKARNNSPFSIEIEFTPDGAGSLEAVNQAVQDAADYLKGQGFKL